MKINLLFIFTIFFITANATVWRVNNRYGVDADFTSLQLAHNGATSGDTLYIEGSPTSYGDCTFTKQLHVVGAGYLLNENTETQSYKETSQVRRLTFNNGSQGSVIEGLHIRNYNNNMVLIYTDNITIKKNYFQASYGSTIAGIQILAQNSNNNILQNYFDINNTYTGSSTRYAIGISINNNISYNLLISNNIFKRVQRNNYYNQGYYIKMDNVTPSNTVTINNNVFVGHSQTKLHTHNALLFNNIMVSGATASGTFNAYTYNICSATQFPDTTANIYNNNIQNATMTNVVIDPAGNKDADFQLVPGSLANNSGYQGKDMGAFEDYFSLPYVISGLPYIPAIYESYFPPTMYLQGQNAINNINIKAKSHSDSQ